jgi:hypothetical protein
MLEANYLDCRPVSQRRVSARLVGIASQNRGEGDSLRVEASYKATPVAQASSGVAVALPSQVGGWGDVCNQLSYRTAIATYNRARG